VNAPLQSRMEGIRIISQNKLWQKVIIELFFEKSENFFIIRIVWSFGSPKPKFEGCINMYKRGWELLYFIRFITKARVVNKSKLLLMINVCIVGSSDSIHTHIKTSIWPFQKKVLFYLNRIKCQQSKFLLKG